MAFVYTAKVISYRVVDGDTIHAILDIGWDQALIGTSGKGVYVRMARIKAPELKETGGPEAKEWLEKRLTNITAKSLLTVVGGRKRDDYGRWLGEVYVNVSNINDEMMQAGHAKPYTTSIYEEDESEHVIVRAKALKAHECLGEVNMVRNLKGLGRFAYSQGLTEGAVAAAVYRAEHLMAGHTRNDFAYLPEGVNAGAAGCAAWPPDMGWGACCTYENWKVAGAAYALGSDGKRYMHLFVANDIHAEPFKDAKDCEYNPPHSDREGCVK